MQMPVVSHPHQQTICKARFELSSHRPVEALTLLRSLPSISVTGPIAELLGHVLFLCSRPRDRLAQRLLSDTVNTVVGGRICTLGNYLSLSGRHAEAARCFAALDGSEAALLAAQEYIELCRSMQAMQSFRTVLQADPQDYRAWYGVGQVYEVLEAYERAIDYYKRAALSRPSDQRMWQAIGRCYERIGCTEQAAQYNSFMSQ